MSAQEGEDPLGDGGVRSPVAALRWVGVPAIGGLLAPLRRRLANWASATGMADDQVESMVLATDEAVSNVVCHAYDPDQPGTFDLLATHDPGRAVQVTVADHGRWRSATPQPGLLHGRGLVLIRMLANETVIERSADGTTVRMGWLLA